MAEPEQTDLTTLTVDLLSAYFASNTVDSGNLAGLIKTTHEALKDLNSAESSADAGPEHVPAVSVRKSLSSPDHIISMIDGKPYKTLKRHLGTHGLTPAEYRERYKLPRDYPLVAKSYSEHRRKVAEQLGLGRKVRQTSEPAPVPVKATRAKSAAAPKVKAEAAPAPAAKSAPRKKAAAAATSAAPAPAAAPKRAPRTKKGGNGSASTDGAAG
jgi:predicted transcriptional regulator